MAVGDDRTLLTELSILLFEGRGDEGGSGIGNCAKPSAEVIGFFAASKLRRRRMALRKGDAEAGELLFELTSASERQVDPRQGQAGRTPPATEPSRASG